MDATDSHVGRAEPSSKPSTTRPKPKTKTFSFRTRFATFTCARFMQNPNSIRFDPTNRGTTARPKCKTTVRSLALSFVFSVWVQSNYILSSDWNTERDSPRCCCSLPLDRKSASVSSAVCRALGNLIQFATTFAFGAHSAFRPWAPARALPARSAHSTRPDPVPTLTDQPFAHPRPLDRRDNR